MSSKGIDFTDLDNDIKKQKELLLLLAQNELIKYVNY